jgi:hypothetical protein
MRAPDSVLAQERPGRRLPASDSSRRAVKRVGLSAGVGECAPGREDARPSADMLGAGRRQDDVGIDARRLQLVAFPERCRAGPSFGALKECLPAMLRTPFGVPPAGADEAASYGSASFDLVARPSALQIVRELAYRPRRFTRSASGRSGNIDERAGRSPTRAPARQCRLLMADTTSGGGGCLRADRGWSRAHRGRGRPRPVGAKSPRRLWQEPH